PLVGARAHGDAVAREPVGRRARRAVGHVGATPGSAAHRAADRPGKVRPVAAVARTELLGAIVPEAAFVDPLVRVRVARVRDVAVRGVEGRAAVLEEEVDELDAL